MKGLTEKFVILAPFVAVILLNMAAVSAYFNPQPLTPYLWFSIGLGGLAVLLGGIKKIYDPLGWGLVFVLYLGVLSLTLVPELGEAYLHRIITGLYLGLFLGALVPPLVGRAPFTYRFSQKKYPEAVQKLPSFVRINLILNYLWALIFLVCAGLSVPVYSESLFWNQIWINLGPALLQLGIGVPVTIFLPPMLISSGGQGTALHFESLSDAFEAMPFGLNKDRAKGVELTIQFHFSGKESFDAWLNIVNQRCEIKLGEVHEAGLVINSDSELWLQITNQEISGDEAYIQGRYTAVGDLSPMLNFQELFSSNSAEETFKEESPQSLGEFQYSQVAPGSLERVLVIDGGPRHKNYSKTSLMAGKFAEGAEAAGALVDYVSLKDLDLSPCTGCYTCWSKTPGDCRIDDDMEGLRLKLRQADLVVYASPLYTFSMHPLLKVFLDRTLPELRPEMQIAGDLVSHPPRQAHPKGMVVFSAAGFPDLKGNFEGFAWAFRNISAHGENGGLLAEFYLPAAELLSQPVYSDRRARVEAACFEAGQAAVEQGEISEQLMKQVANTGVSLETFKRQADLFWEALEGKSSYFRAMPKLHTR